MKYLSTSHFYTTSAAITDFVSMYRQEETKYPRLNTFMENSNLGSYMNNLLTFLSLLEYQTEKLSQQLHRDENDGLILISQLVDHQNRLFAARILDRTQVYHSLTRLRDIRLIEKRMVETLVKNEIGCIPFPENNLTKLIDDIDESEEDRNNVVTRTVNLLNFFFQYQKTIQMKNKISLQEQLDRVLSNKVLLTNTSWWYSLSEFTKRRLLDTPIVYPKSKEIEMERALIDLQILRQGETKNVRKLFVNPENEEIIKGLLVYRDYLERIFTYLYD
ncbi:MAG: hypothetical protein ACW99A_19590 [Candidatus Kariarchaeaceae archaeon]|jgi:hypothetical protein